MDEYLKKLCHILDERGIKTKIKTVSKNNGTEKVGLEYLSDNQRIHPVIYLDSYYEDWKESGNLHDKEIEQCLKQHVDGPGIDTSDFENWDKVKDRVVFRLVNKEKNKTLLSNVPHVELGEFAVIFTYVLKSDMLATVTITNQLSDLWNKDTGILYSVAAENSPVVFPYEIRSMNDFIRQLLSTEDMPDPIPMYILSNQAHMYGASTVLYSDVLRQLAIYFELDRLYLIPSSVHEWIVLPFDESHISGITDMIKEVNSTVVSPEEVLSDNLYVYDVTDDSFTIVQ